MEQRVSISISDGIADVRLVRADKMNALDAAMFEALVAATGRLAREKSLRAVVLSGEGRAFCAGLDMGRFAAMKESGGGGIAGGEKRDLSVRTHGLANFPQQAVWGWRQLPVPVIAAVQGVAFGGGFQLALGPDIRIVAPDTRLAVLEIKWGLVPDMAGLVLLRGLVRDDVARELTYTGRIFSGEEAFAMGIATRVSNDPHGEAMKLAAEIASKNPEAVRAGKRLFNLVADADQKTILLHESKEQGALIGTPNQVEAVMSNMQKRVANYSD